MALGVLCFKEAHVKQAMLQVNVETNQINPQTSTLLDYQLLDFSFFEHHVLANFRIKLFDLHFARHVTFVFVCGVVKTGTRR
jgi:hypothetical protein